MNFNSQIPDSFITFQLNLDTLTHIVLGACIGEAIAGKQLGKKALLLGAIAQNIPDIDFAASFWLPTTTDLLAHRGFTHSLLFTVLFTPVIAWVSLRLSKTNGMNLKQWALFWGLQIFIHIFIDAFNAYGTGWFEPFSHYRVSFNTMFVADPLFAIWPALAMIVLLILKKTYSGRIQWAKTALVLSSIYLLAGIAFKLFIDTKVEHSLQNSKITGSSYFTTPTPLNNLLWYIVIKNDSGYNIGYSSVLDKGDRIDYHYASRNDSLLRLTSDSGDKERLIRFSQGYYTVEWWHDTLVFNDLRFGEMLGWEQPHPRAVLHYYLQHPGDNKLIVQRGRFAGWNGEVVKRFMRRIKGS